MTDVSLLLFVPTLFAMVALFTRRNFFCMYMAIMVWLQSVVVTASWRPVFSPVDRERLTFVCLLLVLLSFALLLWFLVGRRREGGR